MSANDIFDIDSISIFVMSRARDAVQEMHPEKIFELQENKEMYITAVRRHCTDWYEI